MSVPVVIPAIPCSLLNVIVEIPADKGVTLDMLIPIPTSVKSLSIVSFVILFFKSLVVTLPRGVRFANVFVEFGESFTLSRSN